MRLWLLLLIVPIVWGIVFIDNRLADQRLVVEGNSCEMFYRRTWIKGTGSHGNDKLQLLAKDYASRLSIGRTPLVCMNNSNKGYFAFSALYKCETIGYCVVIFIRKDISEMLGDAVPAVIGHEVGHWTNRPYHCHENKEFRDYTKCEHRVDFLGASVAGTDTMIRMLERLAAFSREKDEEPYPNAVLGWEIRIQMLKEVKLSP